MDVRRKNGWLCGVAMGAWLLMPALGSAAVGTFEPLEIDTASGAHRYEVEVMTTEAEREHGLMDRKSMPADHGMLFDFQRDRDVAFWMKDTYIPLDMIFIDHAGRVVAIKHDAKPMDETPIPSGAPTTGVLELNAGAADAIELKIGDRVKHKIFHDAP